MRRRVDWCDWRGLLHHLQGLLSFLVRDFWGGHAPQALVVVLGLLRPLTGREDHNRLIGAAYTHVGDRRYPGKRRAQLGLAGLRGVAGPGDLPDARRVVVLGTRGQAALPPFCSAGLGRRRHRICGAPLHGLRCRSLRWRLAGSLWSVPCGVACLCRGRAAASRLPHWRVAPATLTQCAPLGRGGASSASLARSAHSHSAPPRTHFQARISKVKQIPT